MGRLKDILTGMMGKKTPSQKAVDMAVYADRLAEIKRDLGVNYVLHPQYKPTLAHRYSGSLIMEKVKADALKRGVIL